ncbi:hypothetical protein [Blastopirellula marina]|uniref:Glycoside hydrolase family 2 immunoglobulin-like beta-sandwich domain-containing protein n=1 Tax=Blastopirellula marina TaxID=124 RepID=A0A2S8GH88_9BACT|nr:hypothetical protein [Blastopirellula marina]PQO40058.1 hypothetical protein C5Y98_07015 [Blastopirellula marina]PQO43651.1 hypothetical protein C5Y93_23720 [Blastopirellula marina]PTL45433.1 hypothetical protein C5Y97_07015 [Blastopirellula marina]
MTPDPLANPWTIRQGATSEARVELWIDGPVDADTRIEGPTSSQAKTLTARYRVESADGGPAPFRAILPEPNFWTPRTPNCYRLSQAPQPFGLRDLHVRGSHLWLEDHRFVLRAAAATPAKLADLTAWRSTGLAAIVAAPSQELCERALHAGLFLIADLSDERHDDVAGQVARLSAWASVALAILPGRIHLTNAKLFAPHLPLACLGEEATPPWADIVINCLEENVAIATPTAEQPEILWRCQSAAAVAPDELRLECDRLAAEVVGASNFCGLWVGSVG